MEFSIDDSPAAKALGPLFKLTEVHLWDDGLAEVRESSYFEDPLMSVNGDFDYEKGDSGTINGFGLMPEDLELANMLNGLGLPLSFNTYKQKRNGMVGGKRKGARKNVQLLPVETGDSLLDSVKLSEEESKSHAILLNTSKLLDQNEMLDHAIIADVDNFSNLSLEMGDSMSSTACTCALITELNDNHEVSDLEFFHNLGRNSAAATCVLSKAVAFPFANESVFSAVCQDDESFLITEDAACSVEDIRGEIASDNRTHLAMDDDAEGQLNVLSSEVVEDGECGVVEDHHLDNSIDWITCWDDFYTRTYFYNVKTQESTWDPPPGMDHLVSGKTTDESTNVVVGLAEMNDDQVDLMKSDNVQASCDALAPTHLYLAEESITYNGSISQQFDQIAGNCLNADNTSSTKTSKRNKKVKRTKSKRVFTASSEDIEQVQLQVTPSISKYWCQRYRLFSRFDRGIKMDEEGWFSVTPELIAKHHAGRCGPGTIIDFFTGVGGNAIQFAQRSKHVTAIDIDPNKIEYARHNAAIYGVHDNIDFITGDSFSLALNLKADTVFMSPPWGGPDYSKVKKFDMNTMLKPHDGHYLFSVGKQIASKIVMFLPRNVDINQLAELSLSATPPWSLEVERNFLNDRLKAVTAYFTEPSIA